METAYNARCPAVKRLLREAKELAEPTEEYFARPLEDNLFEWHFTVRGPPETDFDGGIFHGRIILPAEYPMKPPNIIFLTPNGRFETYKKICLSISGHHPETWQPSWSIRTALLAIIGFMPTPAAGTIGALEYTPQERAHLAKRSQEFECPECGAIKSLLKDRTGDNRELQKEAREISHQVTVTAKVESKDDEVIAPPTETSTVNPSVNSPTNPPIEPSAINTAEAPQHTTSSSESHDVSRVTMHPTTASGDLSGVQNAVGGERGHPRVVIFQRESGLSSLSMNILLSTAVALFVALLLRRLWLMDTGNTMDDVLL